MWEKTLSTRKYFTRIEQLEHLSEQEKDGLRKVTERFAFRCNDYYLSLIDWSEPDDPIRHIVIPHPKELERWGRLDPSNEKAYTILPGLEHKYNSTALLLVSNQCAGLCRYCFRKRVFIEKSQADYLQDIEGALEYISEHDEITNVLLTGGDPLMLQTGKLENLISRLRQIEHVQIIRIGTKIPVYNPYRIIEDPALLQMINTYSIDEKKLYVVTHFVHPREITEAAIEACDLIQNAGAKMCNQTPLVRGINDNPDTLAELFAKLSFIGVIPYYVFQCRPAVGNKGYTVPIEEAYEIFEQAKSKVSGLAKRARFVMSHSTGKIEVVGKTKNRVYFKYHRAADDKDSGKFPVFRSNPKACWFDDYDEIIRQYPIELPYRAHGPD
jgi:lysine 2,3-aminomutase